MNKIINLKERYRTEVIPEMERIFKYGNHLAVPKIKKVVLNVGIGKISKEDAKVSEVESSLAEITGQKAVKTKARKAISGFKIRQGQEVGVAVTLRKEKMWAFIERLVNTSLPRIRDFQGIDQKAIDNGGNLNIGIKEHMVFPEIVPEKVKNSFGFQITIVTNARKKEEAKELFKLLGFPIKDAN